MIIKIILLGICVCILSMILKQHQSVYIVILDIVFVISVVFMIFDGAIDAVNSVIDLLNISTSTSKMLTCLLKSLAVCILSKFASDICKESGNNVVSDMIDFGGRIMLLIISLPFIESIIKTATAFVT